MSGRPVVCRAPGRMKRALTFAVAMSGFTLLTVAGPACAAPGAPPSPSGVYGLTPGIYVARGTDCASPPNAAIKQYDGKGISTAHTRECDAHVISTRRAGKGTTYEVRQTCIDAGAGPGKAYTENQTVAVRDTQHFAIASEGNTAYRYCPVDKLPAELRSAASR